MSEPKSIYETGAQYRERLAREQAEMSAVEGLQGDTGATGAEPPAEKPKRKAKREA